MVLGVESPNQLEDRDQDATGQGYVLEGKANVPPTSPFGAMRGRRSVVCWYADGPMRDEGPPEHV